MPNVENSWFTIPLWKECSTKYTVYRILLWNTTACKRDTCSRPTFQWKKKELMFFLTITIGTISLSSIPKRNWVNDESPLAWLRSPSLSGLWFEGAVNWLSSYISRSSLIAVASLQEEETLVTFWQKNINSYQIHLQPRGTQMTPHLGATSIIIQTAFCIDCSMSVDCGSSVKAVLKSDRISMIFQMSLKN